MILTVTVKKSLCQNKIQNEIIKKIAKAFFFSLIIAKTIILIITSISYIPLSLS